MKARLNFSAFIAVLVLVFTAWCFIDGVFCLGQIGFLVLDIILLEYLTIKKKKEKTFALILNIIVVAIGIALLSIGINHKDWLFCIMGCLALVVQSILIREIAKSPKLISKN
ncbi:MAG: hypothetical protein J6V23_10010 [Bacteroidaceae bacterium]|nr:hypothetical protein [Bacteroidaceae bacterium]